MATRLIESAGLSRMQAAANRRTGSQSFKANRFIPVCFSAARLAYCRHKGIAKQKNFQKCFLRLPIKNKKTGV
ncbi:MAG: hypothetical protein J6Y31_02825 [Bacteroidales bacterium]|nr:hypothetical protein [Bacteroidales bacterium]MBP5373833.1 hypothetical protein [Bacteroidales bacterium]